MEEVTIKIYFKDNITWSFNCTKKDAATFINNIEHTEWLNVIEAGMYINAKNVLFLEIKENKK